MTRCYEFYCAVLKNPEFCDKSDSTISRITTYIEFMQKQGIQFDRSPTDKARFIQLQIHAGVTEHAVTQPTSIVQEESIDSVSLITETPKIQPPKVEESVEKCSVCEVLPEDVQKQVQECVERARLSPEEVEDLVKVVQETPKEELSRLLMTPRAAIYQLHAKKPQAKPQVREWKPIEKPEQRVAVMHPQHSKIEEDLLIKLNEAGLHPVVDHEFCVQTTTPDFWFPAKMLAIYIDGKPHENREDRDQQLRDRLAKVHNIRVVSIAYNLYALHEIDRIFKQILEA